MDTTHFSGDHYCNVLLKAVDAAKAHIVAKYISFIKSIMTITFVCLMLGYGQKTDLHVQTLHELMLL